MGCGRNLYEVFTGLLILEKNAGIFVDADFLGGAHPVCPLMGKLEHKIYLKKYSRKEMERQDRLEQQAPAEIPEEILQDAASDYAEMDLPKKTGHRKNRSAGSRWWNTVSDCWIPDWSRAPGETFPFGWTMNGCCAPHPEWTTGD